MSSVECKTCHRHLSLDFYYKDKYAKSGYKKQCKDCIKGNKADPKISNTLQAKKPETSQRYHPYQQNAQSETDQALDESMAVRTDYPEFDFHEKLDPEKHYSIVDIAARNSGKTTTIKWLWPFLKGLYDIIFFFSQSLKAPIYQSFLEPSDKRFCFPTFNHDLLQDLKHLQDATDNGLRLMMMFDDDIDYNQHKNDKFMTNLYTKGRNDGMTIYFSTQSLFAVNPNARENIDYVFIRNIRTPRMKEKVIENFLLDVVECPEICNTKGKKVSYLSKWIDKNTEDYTVVVIDFLNRDIYKFKADPDSIYI